MSPLQQQSLYRRTFTTVLILLVIVSALVRWRLDPVPIRGEDVPVAEFSADRAVKMLSTILGDQRPHPVDSSAQSAVRERIITILEDLGYTVDVQDTTACNQHWGVACARVRNLVVLSPGTTAGKSIMLMAHYDSVPAGPGASDDGSGVAILLDIAGLLKAHPPARNAVMLLFTDGEEAGLLGARAFVQHDPRAKHIALAINVESRGTSGQSVMFQTGDDSGWLVNTLAATARRPLTNSLLSAVYDLMPNDTDFTVFKNEGIPGLNFAFGEHFSYYHTPKDNLQSLDLRTLQQQGNNAYRIVSALRDADLADAAQRIAGTPVYTDILGFGVISWPSSWSLGIFFTLLVLFAFVAIKLRRRYSVSLGSVALGLVCFFLVVALGGTSAWLLSRALALIHGPGMAWHSNAFGNRLLLWSIVLLATVWLPRLLTRKSNPLGLLAGVGVAWLVTGILTALLLPGLAYLFVLPAAALVVMGLTASVVPNPWRERVLGALFVVPALVVFIVAFPAVYIMEVLITFSLPGAIGMGVFLGLAATSLIPLAASADGGRTHLYTGAAVALVAAIGAAMSLSAPAYNASHPQPLNIQYVQDVAGNGHVFTATQRVRLPVAVQQAMGADGSYQAVLPWNAQRYFTVPVSYPSLPVPDLTILANHKTAQGREVLASIDAGPATQRLTVLVPKSAGLVSVEMDGLVVSYQEHASEMGHYQSFVCHGESCDGKQLKLLLTRCPDGPLLVVKAIAGVPLEAESILQARDNSEAIPMGRGDETLIVNSIRL